MGATQITARDQTRFFLHINRFLSRRHRAFGMRLLRSITGSQRWGVGEVAPRGWHLYFKGGWGYGTGLLDHQVVLLTRGCARMSLAVLTMYDGSHPYGKATLRGIFARLLRGLPTGAPLYPVVRGTRYSGLVKAGSPRGARARGQVSAGSINFATGPGGQQVRRLAVTLTGPGDLCAPVGEPVRFRWPTITVSPRAASTPRPRRPPTCALGSWDGSCAELAPLGRWWSRPSAAPRRLRARSAARGARDELSAYPCRSGRPDSNRGPPPPKGGALPGCATPREPAVYPRRHRVSARLSSLPPRDGQDPIPARAAL